MSARTYYGYTVAPATGTARIHGWRWEVYGLPGRPFVVYCDTLDSAREAVRGAR